MAQVDTNTGSEKDSPEGERGVETADPVEQSSAQGADDESLPVAPGDTTGEVDGSESVAANQLGIERYVLAAFFAAGMLGAYVLGKAIHGIWTTLAMKDWFNRALPALAAVSDEDKTTYGLVGGGIISLLLVLRTYKKPEVRTWADEVATELSKVKWPTRKDVTNSTIVVIVAGFVAMVYLTLLDRFWSFVTNLVYGNGS